MPPGRTDEVFRCQQEKLDQSLRALRGIYGKELYFDSFNCDQIIMGLVR